MTDALVAVIAISALAWLFVVAFFIAFTSAPFDKPAPRARRARWSLVAALAWLFAGTAAANPRLDIGLDEHVGARVPTDVPFTDSTHRPVTLAAYLGHRPIVLVMAYARCSMLCSVVLRGLGEAIRKTDGDYLPIVVSLDHSETPDEAARRQNKLLENIGHPGDRARWPYLVGDEAAVRALANTLGFRYAWDPDTKQYSHPAVVFVLTPDGRVAEYVRGVTFDGLGAAIRRAADGQLTTSTTRDLLACFHFDPALRRYEANIALFFKLGAGLVLMTLGLIIAALVIWERRHAR